MPIPLCLLQQMCIKIAKAVCTATKVDVMVYV